MPSIKHAVADFDGVFYPLDVLGAPEVFARIHRTSLSHATTIVYPDITRHQIAILNEIDHTDEYAERLLSFSLPQDCPQEQSLAAMHLFQGAYHHNLFSMVEPHHEKIFAPARPLRQDFVEAQARNVTFGILSMGEKDHWINPALNCMGLNGLFQYTLDYGGCGFTPKHISPEPLARALRAGSCEPAEAVFIDDRKDNLVVAKSVFPELTTIWVKPKYQGDLPSHIDHHVRDLKGALRLILSMS